MCRGRLATVLYTYGLKQHKIQRQTHTHTYIYIYIYICVQTKSNVHRRIGAHDHECMDGELTMLNSLPRTIYAMALSVVKVNANLNRKAF